MSRGGYYELQKVVHERMDRNDHNSIHIYNEYA